jgi:hypothetical protein
MSGPVKRDAFIQNVTTSLPVPTNGPLLHVLTMVYIRIISKPKKNITPECLWIALAYPNISVFASLFRLVFLTNTSVEKGREPYCTLDIELLHISKTKKTEGTGFVIAHAFHKKTKAWSNCLTLRKQNRNGRVPCWSSNYSKEQSCSETTSQNWAKT